MPSNSRRRNDIIYKVAEQLFALYYSLLTFSCLTNSIFQNSQIVLISLYLLVGNFFRKWAKVLLLSNR